MIQIRPSTQSQFLVTCSLWQHYFLTFSGLRDTSATSQYADGMRQRIFQLKGPKTISEFTISAAFDPVKHADILDAWKAQTCEYVTFSVTPVQCGEDPQPIGSRQLIMPSAQLTSVNAFTVDRSSANPSTIEITAVTDDWTYA